MVFDEGSEAMPLKVIQVVCEKGSVDSKGPINSKCKT